MSTLRERIEARRAKLKDTMVDSDGEPSSRQAGPPDHTWAAAMEEDGESVAQTRTTEDQSVEMEDEVKQTEELKASLSRRRKRTQKEVSKKLREKESEENVSAEMKASKRLSKQRFMEETALSATEGEETAASADSDGMPGLAERRIQLPDEDEPDAAMTTRSQPKTPREVIEEENRTSSTPRRVSLAMSQSIKMRLNEKMSEKMRAAKDKGKDEAYSETKKTSSLRGLRGTQQTTRFDDSTIMPADEHETESALEKSLETRRRWKDVTRKTSEIETIPGPTQEESFNFFTRQFEPVEDEKEAGASSGQPEEEPRVEEGGDAPAAAAADAEAEAEPVDETAGGQRRAKKKKEVKSDDEEPLLEALDLEEDSWRMYVIGRAEYRPFHIRMADELVNYYLPSMRAAKMEDKIFGKEQARYLEDEGFYVGMRPDVPPRNLHKMENRLLKEGERSAPWFGEDGQLIALPDPLKEICYRPPILEEIEEDLQTDYKKAVITSNDGRYIAGLGDGLSHYQLDVDVNTLAFTHHHLYSREHVSASRLAEQYQQYVARTRKNAAQYLTEKLKALQSASQHVQENIDTMKKDRKHSRKALADQESRRNDYLDEIKQTRKQRDDEMKADRKLSKSIIQTWKEIKQQRQHQDFTNTTVKLQIIKEPTVKANDEEEWEADMQDELDELKEEQEVKYHSEMETYNKNMEKWREEKQKRKDALQRRKDRRKRQRRRGQDDDEEDLMDADLDQADDDDRLIAAESITKPEKPKPVSDTEARGTILERFHEIRRKPGEPKLYFELSHGATVSPAAACPKAEQSRRNDVNKTKIFVRVLFNNKEVSQTPAKSLGQDFLVRFAQIFNIEIMQWPQSIKLEVHETTGMGSTLLSELYSAIPEPHITTDTVHLDEVECSSDIIKTHNHTAVGSGMRQANNKPAVEGNFDPILMTSATLSSSVAWALNDHGEVLVPPTVNQANTVYYAMKGGMDAVAAIGASGMADMDKLSRWIAESHLDPNDPGNADLMFLMRPSSDSGASGLRMPEHFRLEQLQEEFNFARDDDIDGSRRFRMIQLREKEVPAFRNKSVPAFDKEIPEDLFSDYERQKREENKLKDKDDSEHQVAVAKFMQQQFYRDQYKTKVREQVMLRFRLAAHQKILSDMVFEDAVPNIGTIIPSLVKLTEPRRPLRPVRKERKKVTAQNLQTSDVKILVNIVRAFGIPVRATEQESNPGPPGPNTSRTAAGVRNIAGSVQVRPYVEVMFQHNVEATSVADGPNPSWNEELPLSFKPPNNDFSSSNLQTVKDDLYLNLFDELIVDAVQEDRERGTTVVRRIEKKWLGSLKIPFSTIYFNSRIEGTFRISKPPVLLGYSHEPPRQNMDGMEIGVGDGSHTYVTMFITVEPALTPAEHAHEKFDSNEDEKLLGVCDTWQLQLEKKHPKRDYKTTVVDINGKSVFVTRYFRSLKPPDNLFDDGLDMKNKCEIVARYVSLIPFVSDSVVFPGLCDIWSTCDQFLQMLQGDEEEHAVLLANYFLSLGKKTYLLLGSAIPEGPTAYVLTDEGGDYWIWNASTGQHYSYRDNYCPVQSIGCLVNADNVWANIQANDIPSRVQFDLHNAAHWKPFFHKGFPNPGMSSVQPSELLYFPTDRTMVVDQQERIERVLKEKIMSWRSQFVTRWNRYCVQAFRRLLIKLEESRGVGAQQEHSQELQQILGSYKLCGFPINLPFTGDYTSIIDSVFSTGVHNYESSDVEFALAVHIHPYPNSVLSVWIYVANLVRKR